MNTTGYKILVLVPFNGPSQWNYMKIVIKELINQNHEVTAITTQPMNDFNLTKYEEVLIDPPIDFSEISKMKNLH